MEGFADSALQVEGAEKFEAFGEILKTNSPLVFKEVGRALHKVGRLDMQTLQQQLPRALAIRSNQFLHSFHSRAADSRLVDRSDQLELIEYTGAKPMRIFQTGGDIHAQKGRALTILTDEARGKTGRRKYSQSDIKALIASGQAGVIKILGKAAVILFPERTKRGKYKKGRERMVVLAWLQPAVHEQKRIDFYGNFDANAAEHARIFDAAVKRSAAALEAEVKQ